MTTGAERARFVGSLAGLVGARRAPHTVRVAIDGPDAAGKTTLGRELATALAELGRPAICVSADGFLAPALIRHRRGRLSAEGLLADGIDLSALRRELLDPLGPDGDARYRSTVFDVLADRPCLSPRQRAPFDAVLIVDGVFLLRPGE